MKRPIHILLTTLLILFVSVLSSCVKEERFYPEQDPTRVLLVYVGTDNNLAGYEQEKLQGIRDGWTGKSTDRIIAYIDKAGADARLIEISNLAPGEQPRELAVYGRENSASAETLSRVISFVTTNYPADSYGLLVFSHASGWLPSGALTNPTTYGSVSGNQTGKLGVNPTATRNTTVLNDIALSSEKGLAIADSLKSQSHFLLLSGNGSLADDAKGHQSHDPQNRTIITDGSNEIELRDFAAAIPDGVFDYIVVDTFFMAEVEVRCGGLLFTHDAPV